MPLEIKVKLKLKGILNVYRKFPDHGIIQSKEVKLRKSNLIMKPVSEHLLHISCCIYLTEKTPVTIQVVIRPDNVFIFHKT